MAVPKKRTSVSRKGLRRAGQHHKLFSRQTAKCPNCGDIVLSHHACSSCGHYNGRQCIDVKVQATEETASAE